MDKSLFQSSLELEAELLSQQYDIKVIFKGVEAYTDGKSITLPSLPENLDEKSQSVFRGFLAHEVGHCLFTDWGFHRKKQSDYSAHIKQWKKTKKPLEDETLKAYLMAPLSNIFEDPFVEREMIEEYPGCKSNLKNLALYFDSVIPNYQPKELNFWDKLLMCLYYSLFDYKEDKLNPKKFGEKVYNVIQDRLKDEIADSRRIKNTRDSYTLAEKTFEKLKEFYEEEKQDSQDENDSDSENTENNLTKEEQGQLTNFEENSLETIETLLGKEALLSESIEDSIQSSGLSFPRPYTKEKDFVEKIETYTEKDQEKYNQVLDSVKQEADYLRRKFLLSLKSKHQIRWRRNLSKGKLDFKKLNKVIKLNYNPQQRLNIHKIKTQGLNLKTAVSILIDCSGSMVEEEAHRVLVTLSEPLSQINIPTEIVGYTTTNQNLLPQAMRDTQKSRKDLTSSFTRFSPLNFKIYKEFSEPFRNVKYRLGSYKSAFYTPIFEALEFAGKRLFSYKAGLGYRKIMFVITDGFPNYLGGENHMGMLLNMIPLRCQELQRHGVEVCGIGLRAPFVKKVFPNSVITEDDNYTNLVNLLLEKLGEYFNVG